PSWAIPTSFRARRRKSSKKKRKSAKRRWRARPRSPRRWSGSRARRETIAVKIFVAGASGAIGRRLTPLLLAAGHAVTGMTRTTKTVRELEAAGVHAVVGDVFDAAALKRDV